MVQAVHENYQWDPVNVLCDQCDLVVELPPMENGDKAHCPRCDNRLTDYQSSSPKQALIYGLCALLMFIIACIFHLVDIRTFGNINSVTIATIPRVLFFDNYVLLSLLFIAFVLLCPFLCMLSLVIVCSGIPIPRRFKVILLAITTKLQYWCMAEIFLAGVLVSFVKLTRYGDIDIDISFLPYCFFILLQIKAFSVFSTTAPWHQIAPVIQTTTAFQAGKTGIEQGIRLCQCCHAILSIHLVICPRCYERGHVRIRQSLQWTLALLFIAMMLYIPANAFAVMKTFFIGNVMSSTILDGVSYMWKEGDYPIAIIIFTASILIPVIKIIALFWLCYFSAYSSCGDEGDCLKMNKIYNFVEFTGRWSMIDMFVVAVTSTLIRNGIMISVYPDVGAVFFTIVVVITMIASQKYDPRLIWDKMACRQLGR